MTLVAPTRDLMEEIQNDICLARPDMSVRLDGWDGECLHFALQPVENWRPFFTREVRDACHLAATDLCDEKSVRWRVGTLLEKERGWINIDYDAGTWVLRLEDKKSQAVLASATGHSFDEALLRLETACGSI